MDLTKSSAAVCSRQVKKDMKEKAKLEAAFESAKSAYQMDNALDNMINSQLFEIRGLDFACWKFAQQASAENKNLTFGASSSQRNKIKRKKAFHNAKSTDEMVKEFQKMELCFEEKEIGMDAWRMTQRLFEERQDPEKILYYGRKGLKYVVEDIASTDNKASLMMISDILPILGYASWKLKRFEEGLSYLNWSKRNLSYLESDNSIPAELVYSSLGATHFNLAIVTAALGKGEEAVVHLTKTLEIQERAKAEGKIDPEIKMVSIDRAVNDVVKELLGLGIRDKGGLDGAVRLLKEMKGSDGGRDSLENSKCSVASSKKEEKLGGGDSSENN